jgi:pimeloyl-ACP methyl ester carboxylesterase
MTQMIQTFTPYAEVVGEGDPIVLVHGGWTDGSRWGFVAPELAHTNTAVVYDRRGHSRSVWSGAVTRRTDEDDLAELIDRLGCRPAHLVGNSYGAAIALGTAARYPDLVRSVAGHEPPLLGVARFAPALASEMDNFAAIAELVADDIRRNEATRGAQRFVEDAVFGPGAWAMLPDSMKSTMVANAWTFVGMLQDQAWADVPAAPGRDIPVLLTDGDQTPAWLPHIVAALLEGPYRAAQHATFAGAGHSPHVTHPAEFVEVVRDFIASA